MNVFSGRPIKFQDRDIRADELRAAMINLKNAAQEAFGNKNIDDIAIDGFENRNGMNVRGLVVKFSVVSDDVKRRKFMNNWAMPTSDTTGSTRVSNVPIGFLFVEPKGMN